MPSEAISISGDGMRPNRCGAAVFVLDRWSALDRFLIIGSAGGTYYAQASELRMEHLLNLLAVLDEDGPRAVARIAEISGTGRAPKNSAAVAALALAASVGLKMPKSEWFVSADRTGDTEARAATRALALAALPSVCRIPTDLFAFVSWVRRLRGFGRAVSKAVADWYLRSPVDRLALHGIKYEVRGGVSHADLIRLSHPRLSDEDEGRFALIRWMLAGGIASGVEKRLAAAEAGIAGNPTPSAALRQVEGAEDLLMVNRLGAQRAAERAAVRKAEQAVFRQNVAAERAAAAEDAARRERLLSAWGIDIGKRPAKRFRDESASLFGVSSGMLAAAEALSGEASDYLSPDVHEASREMGSWKDRAGPNTGSSGYPPTAFRFPAARNENIPRAGRAPEPSLFSGEEIARAVDLIERFSLPHEVVPSHLKRERAVWNALLADMPVKAMIRNLPSMTRVGLLSHGSPEAAFVCSRLCDPVLLMKARIHPLGVLEAAMTYARGTSRPEEIRWTPSMMRAPKRRASGGSGWTAVPEILKALDTAFFLAFQNVAPANKRMMLGVDVSGSMAGAFLGRGWLSARDAAAAMCLVTARTEANWQAFGFTSDYEPGHYGYFGTRPVRQPEAPEAAAPKVFPGLTRLNLSKDMTVDQVARNTAALPMGSTDCALLIRYATEARLEVDTFLVLTDNEHNSGPVTPAEALARYRAASGIPARLICVGMTATDYSIADGRDPLCMNVVGFDSAAPRLISDFAAGRL